MCEYLSFVTTWEEGRGLQVYSNRSLCGHAEATQLWGLPDDALRWSWEADGEENLRLSHGHETTPETERARLEVLRLWPTRENLTNYLVSRRVLSCRLCATMTADQMVKPTERKKR